MNKVLEIDKPEANKKTEVIPQSFRIDTKRNNPEKTDIFRNLYFFSVSWGFREKNQNIFSKNYLFKQMNEDVQKL